MDDHFPTPLPELNAVLSALVTGVQEILGKNFVSAFLQGSFASGDWDADSDVDFTLVTEQELAEVELQTLQQMHARIHRLGSEWAKHLDGSYIPRGILKHARPTRAQLWYLDNTFDHLVLSDHDDTSVVRWMLRECGILLAGIPAKELVDCVSADELRQEIVLTMQEWGAEIISGRYSIASRWAQPFVVLSYCRMLHSLETGCIASKLAGAQWAQKALDDRWTGLIQRAWEERPNPSLKARQAADPEEIESTIALIHAAIRISQSYKMD